MPKSPSLTIRVPKDIHDRLPSGERGAVTEFVVGALRDALDREADPERYFMALHRERQERLTRAAR